MMITIKRSFALLFALLMAVSVVLSSCAKPAGNDDETTPAATNDSTAPTVDTEPVETVDMNYVAELPEGLNYGNKEVSILATNQTFSVDEFHTLGTNGNIVNDAVYKRNMAVEDMLGIKLKVTLSPSTGVYSVGDTIRTAVNSGDAIYDITTMPGYVHTTYILEGNFYNLKDIGNLDLTKYYWTQGFNDIMSNGTKQYVASGAYSLSMYRNMYITLYNKDIFASRGLEDLYELTLNGKWTISKLSEMTKDIYMDLNGDSRRDAGDMYGYVGGGSTSTDPFWVALGMRFLNLENGEYVFSTNTEKMVDIVDKMQELLFKNEGTHKVGLAGAGDGAYDTDIISIFSESRTAICTTMVFQLESYLMSSAFTDSYGIAPMPKYDEAQENYYTHIQDQLTVMSAVATTKEEDLPMIGAVMEAISAESYKHVYNAYYETALSYRYLQNDESVVMLNLIYRSIRIEGAFIYSSKYAMLGKMRTVISSGTNTLMSTYKMNKKLWDVETKKLNEQIDKLKH